MIDKDSRFMIVKFLAFGIILAIIAGLACRVALLKVHAAALDRDTPSEIATNTDSIATPTDVVDKHPYLSQNSINGDTMSVIDILLSIRNILIVFLFFEFFKWAHSIIKGVIIGFHKKR